MLVFFIHGVATRDVKYADDLKILIREEFTKRGESLPNFYSSFWGNVLSDVPKMWNWIYQDLQEINKVYPQFKSGDVFRYQKFREGFISEFIGDFFTYLNPERGGAIRKIIAQQLFDFIKNHPSENELHIIAHSLGSVILWDALFSERFNDKDPAWYIRKMINGLSNPSTTRKVTLSSITTMGAPILFANTMLNVKPQTIYEFTNAYREVHLRWVNIIHGSDVVAYPLKSSLNIQPSWKLSFRDEYIWDDANLAEKTARSLGQIDLAMALGAGDAHESYLHCQKTACSIVNNILGHRQYIAEGVIQEVIAHLSNVPGMTKDLTGLSAHIDRTLIALKFRDDSGSLKLYVNPLKVHHAYVFDRQNDCIFRGYVGWIDSNSLIEAVNFIKHNFC